MFVSMTVIRTLDCVPACFVIPDLSPGEQVFKTLAVHGDRNGVCLAVIPGNTELDFKAVAQLTGDRKVDMIPLKEVQAVTGYIRGGVTALACKKDYPVYVDETAELWDVI